MAVQIDLLHPVTDEELLALSDRNPGYQIERTAEGRLVVSPTKSDGGRRSMEVALQLGIWNRQTGLGIIFDSSTGFAFPDGSCRSPDASWVQRERWYALTREQRRSFAPVCPDAVFEIRSESDSLAELRTKMEAYIGFGAKIGVLIDPEARAVWVYRRGMPAEREDNARQLPLGPELPGFALELGPVFDD